MAQVAGAGAGPGGVGIGGGLQSSSGDDLSVLIKAKERELHEFHQLRCDLLEKVVKERDTLLLEASNRFDQLRDDFQYNLTLLEARDKELRRLETVIANDGVAIAQLKADNKALSERCDHLIRKDEERTRQIEEEKSLNKAKVIQMKQEIENLGWLTSEENRGKNREIDTLKSEIARLTKAHRDDLDRQRSELHHTFDRLSEERANDFATREKEISHQILALDERFESIKTENLRLKALTNDSQRRIEQLTDEIAAKDTLLRQFMWQVEDERAHKLSNDDSNQRQITKLSMELNTLKETTTRESEEYKRSLEKLYVENAREVELRKVAESELEERRKQYQDQLVSLQDELNSAQHRINELQVESSNVRAERDNALDRVASARTELDSAETRTTSFNKQLQHMQADLIVARNRIQELEHELQENVAQVADAIRNAEASVRQELEVTETLTNNALSQNQRVNDKELERIKQAMQEVHDETLLHLQSEHQRKVVEFEAQLRRAQIENDRLKGNLYEKENELNHLKEENAALQLRLNIYDQQRPAQQMMRSGPTVHVNGDDRRNPTRHSQDSEGGYGYGFDTHRIGMYGSPLWASHFYLFMCRRR
jgi:chromosome segregation ATPase